MQYFGTDGIRQKATEFTPEFLTKIIKGLIDYAGDNIKVFLAGDTRESTEWILSDLESALETFGVEYSNAGVLPTPAINYCFFEMGFDFAIDVTASHNPYADNGIKIFERGRTHGKKLQPTGCEIIEKALLSAKTYALTSPTLREDIHADAVELYENHLKNYLGEVSFKGLKIGLDCANGATSVINKTIFEELGADVNLINANENYGTEINNNCGSTHLEQLKSLIKSQKLDFGIAFDGDGDRCLMVDENGDEIDGDQIIAILTNYLNLDSAVATVMANQGLINWAKDNRINLEISAVGDQNVVEKMIEKSIEIGGEQSGHVILPGESTGDGMLTALMVTKVVAETKKSLKELASIITKFPQIIVNLEATKDQKSALQNQPAKNLIKEYEKSLEAVSGRLLVRPSGTENLIRITMWGNDENGIKKLANELKNKLGEIL
ncbi:MAG: phosphoglucosamine mutase [Candidatus Saccharibacteria bacterium]|nr:phosphoglucosamine mutase [Candidatus Saccharibacteria bacterium]